MSKESFAREHLYGVYEPNTRNDAGPDRKVARAEADRLV